MATPIPQHTIETYDIYSIIYDSTNTKTKIPLNPNYLLSILKNDNRLISSYTGDAIKTISDYEYSTLGTAEKAIHFTLTIQVIENEMTVNEFVEKVLFAKYDYNNHEALSRLLALASCTKSLMLSVLYILYYSEPTDTDIVNLLFLDNVINMQPMDLYSFVMDKLASFVVNKNPIKIEDYIPTIEVEPMEELDYTVPVTVSNVISVGKSDDYKNLNVITANKVQLVDIDANSVVRTEGDYTVLFQPDYDPNAEIQPLTGRSVDTIYGKIHSYEKISGGWKLEVNGLPRHLISYSGGYIKNISNHLTFEFKKGFTYQYGHSATFFPTSYRFTLSFTFKLNPGESQYIGDQETWGWASYRFDSYQTIYAYKFRDQWYDDMYSDKVSKALVYTNPQDLSSTINVTLKDPMSSRTIVFGSDTLRRLLNPIGFLLPRELSNTVYNNTKHTVFVFPKGFKYQYRGQITNMITRSRTVTRIVTVLETVTRKVIEWVQSIWSWIKGLVKKETEVTEQVERQVEQTETETWVETLVEKYTHTYELEEAIIIRPGESANFPHPKVIDYAGVFKLPEDQVLQAYRYENSRLLPNYVVLNTSQPMDFKTRLIYSSGDEYSDIIAYDSSSNSYIFKARVQYENPAEIASYTAKAIFKLVEPKLNGQALNATTNASIKNALDKGANLNTKANILNLMKKSTVRDFNPLYNSFDIQFTEDNTKPINMTNINKEVSEKNTLSVLKLQMTEHYQQGGYTKLRSFTFSPDSNNALTLYPPNCLINSNTNLIGIDHVYNLTVDDSGYFNFIVNQAIDKIVATDTIKVRYEQDVLYKIKSIKVKPSANLIFTCEKSSTDFNAFGQKDMEFFLKYCDISFKVKQDKNGESFTLSETPTSQKFSVGFTPVTVTIGKANPKSDNTISSKLNRGVGILKDAASNIMSSVLGIANPNMYDENLKNAESNKVGVSVGSKKFEFQDTLHINVEDYNLFYYNGTVYRQS